MAAAMKSEGGHEYALVPSFTTPPLYKCDSGCGMLWKIGEANLLVPYRETYTSENVFKKQLKQHANECVEAMNKKSAERDDFTAATMAVGTGAPKLIGKNVREDIANKIIINATAKWAAQPVIPMQRESTFRSALRESIVEAIKTTREVDVLKEARAAKKKGIIFTVGFCGFTLVGKTSTVFKIAKLLQNDGLKVMVAATDDSAIEKMRAALTTDHNDFVTLYQQRYAQSEDDCKDAIAFAEKGKYDVILVKMTGVPTSGGLFHSVAEVIRRNKFDIMLFVGDASDGMETLEQLYNFDHAMMVPLNQGAPRMLDGMVLSKLDTCGNKVGAALTIINLTCIPIVYVGFGQDIKDFKIFDSEDIVAKLMF